MDKELVLIDSKNNIFKKFLIVANQKAIQISHKNNF